MKIEENPKERFKLFHLQAAILDPKQHIIYPKKDKEDTTKSPKAPVDNKDNIYISCNNPHCKIKDIEISKKFYKFFLDEKGEFDYTIYLTANGSFQSLNIFQTKIHNSFKQHFKSFHANDTSQM